ncbi:putative transposase, partial [Shigella flexneri K-304]
LGAVERRFGNDLPSSPVEWLTDNGSCYRANETRQFARMLGLEPKNTAVRSPESNGIAGFAPIFPDICYHLTHYKPAAADIPVASDNPAHYADAIRYNARTPLQGSLLPLTRLVWA